jgi:hypothetical protein
LLNGFLIKEIKMRKLTVTVALTAVGLVGCATGDYKVYADTQRAIVEAQTSAKVAKIEALSDIAKNGDTTARVAAVISLNHLQQSINPGTLRQPDSVGDTMLKWTSVLLPSLTQFYSIGKSAEIAIVNSNNMLEGKKSDNGMIVDLVQGRVTPIIGTQDDLLIYPR